MHADGLKRMNQESDPEAADESTAARLSVSSRETTLDAGAAGVLSVAYLLLLALGAVALLGGLSWAGLLPRESPYTSASQADTTDLNRGLLSYSLISLWALLLARPLSGLAQRFGGLDLVPVPGFAVRRALVRPTLQAGAAALGAVVFGVILAGARPVAGFEAVDPSPWLRLMVFLIVAAALEEVVFRGFLLRLWKRTAGSGVSLAVTSVTFALLHSGNPSAAPMALLNTVLAGIALGLLALRSGSLWPPLSLHFMWNAAQGPLLGLPVSGLLANGFAVLPMAPGRGLLAGGSYGFEGGLSATLVLALGCGLLSGWNRARSPASSESSPPERWP